LLLRRLLVSLTLLGCASQRAARTEPVIYMVMTDRFADGDPRNNAGTDRSQPGAYHGGDFRGIRDHLGYLADLGVDYLWISPVVDNIEQSVPGPGFAHYAMHGYWVKDYERIEEHFGSQADLREMIDAAHTHHMGVLIDVVLNHAGYGSPWEARADWTRSPKRGDCGPASDELTRCIYGLPDFRTERPEVADYLVRVHARLAATTGCDGFRVDALKHAEHALWQKLRRAVDAVRPGFKLLGEAWGSRATTSYGDAWLSPSAQAQAQAQGSSAAEMDWMYDFEFADQALGFVSGAADARQLDDYLHERAGRADRYVHYLDTHDLPGFLYRVGGDRGAMKLGAVLELTIPGLPLIYYGDEVARTTGAWPQNRSDMPWGDDQDRDMLEHYRRLVRIHHRLAGPVETVLTDGPRYAFRRSDTIILLNAGAESWEVPVAGVYTDVLTSTRCQSRCTVPARTGAVLRPGAH
jgi:alpha-amylase